MIMTPSSDNYIWTYSGWDTIHSNVQNIADNFGIHFIDFNIYKEKSSILHDEDSFGTLWNLSVNGSIDFSKEISDVIRKLNNGEDISSLFYSSYEEVLSNSRYCN